ncbi:hypothetical protein CLOM_g18950 [Closterium sp. NIES-68]|nr:hypothetical protein CLOM_g18950 [Closterium sp. NIES-68]
MAGDAMRRVVEWREKHVAAVARDVADDPARLPARPAGASQWESEGRAPRDVCDTDWRLSDGYHPSHRFAEISAKEAREAVSEEQLAGMRRSIHESAYDMWIAEDLLMSTLKEALARQTTRYKQSRDCLSPRITRRLRDTGRCSSSSGSSLSSPNHSRNSSNCCGACQCSSSDNVGSSNGCSSNCSNSSSSSTTSCSGGEASDRCKRQREGG